VSHRAVEPEYLEQWRRRIEAALLEILDAELIGAPEGLAAPLRYAVLSPGKRIRPLLMMAAYRASGGTSDSLVGLACSVELVHAYSLVHDDLPCMDDDVLRRGRPTVHVRFGVGPAVMVGAALMPLAVRAILRASGPVGLDDRTTRRLVSSLTSASGASGMVGGQLLDLRAEGRSVERAELESIHTGKTARLISASVAMGGIAAGADDTVIARLERFGLRLGLAFQAIDDILDLRGDTQQLGKESGRDTALRKATYPGLFGMEEAERMSRRLASTAAAELAELDEAAQLRDLAGYIINRSH
jgi:geranylgeranyl pyrophosphate synthase